MRLIFVIILFFFNGCLIGQILDLEDYYYEFPDTIVKKYVKKEFIFSIENKLDIRFRCRIKEDTNIITVEFINKHPKKNLWVAALGGFENFNNGRWVAMTIPDFNYQSPMYFLLVKPDSTLQFNFKRTSIIKTFNYSTYLMSDYGDLVKNVVLNDYEPILFDHENEIGLEIPFDNYPEKGIVWVHLKDFPVNLNREKIYFKISNKY